MRGRLIGGEPRVMQDGGAYSEFCCDCELTHFFTVDINYKKKEVTICYFRDDYKTEKHRKENNIVVYQKRGKKQETKGG